MGQATVFENVWPKASDLPQYNPTCHSVQSTQSLPTCTLLYASVSRQILGAPSSILPLVPWHKQAAAEELSVGEEE